MDIRFINKDFFDIVNIFENKKNNGAEHRYMSWEYCFHAFKKVYEKKKNLSEITENDYDYLALHLGFYLASWGMYRGSSFLLQKSYKEHVEAVKYIITNINQCEVYNKNPLLKFWDELSKYYNRNRLNEQNAVDEAPLFFSDTLFSKILLGTVGCMPAYDRYCKAGLSVLGLKPRICEFDALITSSFYINLISCHLENAYKQYPYMKILDMFLFELGMIYETFHILKNNLNDKGLHVNNGSVKAVLFLCSIDISKLMNNFYIKKALNKVFKQNEETKKHLFASYLKNWSDDISSIDGALRTMAKKYYKSRNINININQFDTNDLVGIFSKLKAGNKFKKECLKELDKIFTASFCI